MDRIVLCTLLSWSRFQAATFLLSIYLLAFIIESGLESRNIAASESVG